MDEGPSQTGTTPFVVDSIETPCSTFYKIVGDLESGQPPVIILHGGPGSGHEYLLPFAALWPRYGIPVILYDQVGCASSTHLRHKAGDKTFWTVELFTQQLRALIDALHLGDDDRPGFHILGHSWGGILGSYFASSRPRGLRRLILANAPATIDLHVASLRLRWKELSPEAQRAMEEALRTGDYQSQSYKDSELSLRKAFWSRAVPFPAKELEPARRNQIDDPTTAAAMYGPSPLECSGSLHGWDCFSALPQITAPTLVYIGEFDFEREEAIAPYLEHIPGVRSVIVAGASHMSHVDNAELKEQVMKLVGTFLLSGEVS